jgi:hypothetical protein
VTVSDGTDSFTGTVADGACTLTFTTAGPKSLTAAYAGDLNYDASRPSASVPHQVDRANTTTTITSGDPDPSVLGEAVKVTFTVAPVASVSGTPTGSVTVSDGVDSCTAPVAVGGCELRLTTVGARTLIATYDGDSNFNGSTAAAEHGVDRIGTASAITSDTPNPSVVGQAVTVHYSVSASGGSGTRRAMSRSATAAARPAPRTWPPANAR